MSSPFEVIEVGGIPFAATNLERATDWVVNDRRRGSRNRSLREVVEFLLRVGGAQ
ncbi:hypothetical protein ACQGFJ_14940 [Rhodococcus sp. 3.70]